MPQDEPWPFQTHPHPRHPGVAIGVGEIDTVLDENVVVIRATRREDQRREKKDLDNRNDDPAHAVVLVENSKSEYRNSKQIRISKDSKG